MDYQTYIHRIFPDNKIQKISVNAGFTCPNRDGSIGYGGCIYCRNDSFTPSYCLTGDTVEAQIEKGKKFFSKKYKDMKFLAYFQSYTSTYGKDLTSITQLYEEALACKDVVGLVVGSRPDTLSLPLLDYFEKLNRVKPVFLEIGAESSHDSTLGLINRGHKWDDVVRAVEEAHSRNIHCGLHLIAGLPGEDKEMILDNVRNACELSIETIKLHQLQILKDTPLHRKWLTGEIDVKPFTLEEYLDLCVSIYNIVPNSIVIERFLAQSPTNLVVAPKWGLKNYQFMNLLKNRLKNP